VNFIKKVAVVHDPDQKAHDSNEISELFSKKVKLLFEWGIFLFFGGFFDLLLLFQKDCQLLSPPAWLLELERWLKTTLLSEDFHL
jgi:hypothetical protein